MATIDDHNMEHGDREVQVPERKIGTGALSAALRQGGKEIGEALKAFPDAISVSEPGTILSPTQGEIAEANRGGSIWDRMQEGWDRAETARSQEPEKAMDRE
jgi:hypothetical protein